LREDFRPDSDIDALVEFEPEHVPGLAFFRHGIRAFRNAGAQG
jgi:predicted nucleotidyltransferase